MQSNHNSSNIKGNINSNIIEARKKADEVMDNSMGGSCYEPLEDGFGDGTGSPTTTGISTSLSTASNGLGLGGVSSPSKSLLEYPRSKYDSDTTINNVDAYNQSFILKSGRFATAFLVGYFVISILVSSQWFGFTPLNSVYFSVVTFSTGIRCKSFTLSQC
jgi:hypothetical protein